MKHALTILMTISAGAAMAHPGHGAETQAHWLSDVDHAAVVVLGALVLALGAGIVLAVRRARKA